MGWASAALARTPVKNRLGVTDTSFDTQIDDFITQAINRLFPRAGQEVSMQAVSISPDSYGEAFVDLSTLTTPIADVRLVEYVGTGATAPADNKYLHGTSLRLRDLPSWATSLKLYGLNRHTLSTVPAELELAVIWYAMSEFYELMTASKSKYNIYSQSSGARAVDNMRDEALFYEQKADAHVEEHANLYGSQ
jgi:hypothetical protein